MQAARGTKRNNRGSGKEWLHIILSKGGEI